MLLSFKDISNKEYTHISVLELWSTSFSFQHISNGEYIHISSEAFKTYLVRNIFLYPLKLLKHI